jgi:hypothetical protein
MAVPDMRSAAPAGRSSTVMATCLSGGPAAQELAADSANIARARNESNFIVSYASLSRLPLRLFRLRRLGRLTEVRQHFFKSANNVVFIFRHQAGGPHFIPSISLILAGASVAVLIGAAVLKILTDAHLHYEAVVMRLRAIARPQSPYKECTADYPLPQRTCPRTRRERDSGPGSSCPDRHSATIASAIN